MGKYYIFEDGKVMHEDDFDQDRPMPDNSPGVCYSVHIVPEEIFNHIHNNAVGSCCMAMDNVFIMEKQHE